MSLKILMLKVWECALVILLFLTLDMSFVYPLNLFPLLCYVILPNGRLTAFKFSWLTPLLILIDLYEKSVEAHHRKIAHDKVSYGKMEADEKQRGVARTIKD